MARMRFSEDVAIVTGAGSGLGRLYALALARLGARVVVNDLSREAADRTVGEIRKMRAEAVGDYSNVIDGDAVVRTAIQEYG